jgi:NNP family nitrate/nitrite transporter-like MFS transporter
MPLLIKINFWRQPVPDVVGIGINFAFYAFLGALVGSLSRPLGGYLADKYGGARVTLIAFGGMLVGTLGVLWTLSLLTQLPPPPDAEALAAIKADPAAFQFPDAVQTAVDANSDVFPLFLGMFLLIFFFAGIGNGSTYKMIPAIFRTDAERATTPGTPERDAALLNSTKMSSAAVGIIGAVGAIGGFLIPITFGSPWITDPLAATKTAFLVFAGFYLVCAGVTFWVYLRKPHPAKAQVSYAGVGI